MPYTDSSGVQIPVGTDSFNPTPQFKIWQDGNAKYNNRVIVAIDSDRTSLAAPTLRDGLECYVTGTDITWLYEGSSWKRQTPARGVATFITDAAGLATIAHGLGTVPSAVQLTKVFVSDAVNSVLEISRGALTSSAIQVVAHRMDTHARLLGTSITVEWVAWP